MKVSNLVLAALVLTSQVSVAKTIAKFEFGVRQNQIPLALYEVTLSQTGKMAVKGIEQDGFVGDLNGNEFPVQIEKQLSPAVFNEVKKSLASISDAEIKTTVNEHVCMTIVAVPPLGPQKLEVAAGFDYHDSRFKGKLRLVKTPTGCWFFSHTAPTDIFVAQSVAAVEAALTVLALDAIDSK